MCWNCGENLDDIPRPISRHATCPKCFNELHCCRLCRHYDASANMTCFEDRADPPLQKENANFCDFFSPRFGAFEQSTTDKSGQARESLDALFGGDNAVAEPEATSPPGDDVLEDDDSSAENSLSKEEAARRKLDDLFN